ncbi:hypothetical protein [Nonomuraea sp. NPDC001699]
MVVDVEQVAPARQPAPSPSVMARSILARSPSARRAMTVSPIVVTAARATTAQPPAE